MTNESLSATVTVKALAETVFALIADPASHAAIDGTGWVRDPLDREPLTASGQMFRMAMYHPNHPNGNYEMANLVQVFDPPHAISWKPGDDPGDGVLRFGGWIWLRSARPRPRSGSLTIGRRYPRTCAKQGQSSHLSPPIISTTR